MIVENLVSLRSGRKPRKWCKSRSNQIRVGSLTEAGLWLGHVGPVGSCYSVARDLGKPAETEENLGE